MKTLHLLLIVLSTLFISCGKDSASPAEDNGYVEFEFDGVPGKINYSINALYMRHDANGAPNMLTFDAAPPVKKYVGNIACTDSSFQFLLKAVDPISTGTYTNTNGKAIISKAALLLFDMDYPGVPPADKTYACREATVEYNVEITRFEPVKDGWVEGTFSFLNMEQWVSGNDATVLSSGHSLTKGKFKVKIYE